LTTDKIFESNKQDFLLKIKSKTNFFLMANDKTKILVSRKHHCNCLLNRCYAKNAENVKAVQ